MTEDEVFAALEELARHSEWPAPASEAEVQAAERVIGHPVPPFLRTLYLQVANGGFGPEDGVMGVRGGARGPIFADIAELYSEGPDPTGLTPDGLVLIVDWGCSIWTMSDFRATSGNIWSSVEGELIDEHMSIAEWLGRSVAEGIEPPGPHSGRSRT